jgi:hypothetical protein
MFHVSAFVALILAFLSLALLTRVSGSMDSSTEAATTMWGQPVANAALAENPTDCGPDTDDE